MITKYGQLPDNICEKYQAKLIDKVYKILPLKERHCETVNTYIDSLIYELYGANNVFIDKSNFIILISLLEMIKREDIHIIYKQKIFQCTNDIIPSLFKEGGLKC